jgi:hypothetical protein
MASYFCVEVLHEDVEGIVPDGVSVNNSAKAFTPLP